MPGSHPCPQIAQEELAGATLRVRVLGSKRFSAPEPLGELSLPLGAVDLQHVLEQWYQLGPPGAAEVRPRAAGLQPVPARAASARLRPPLTTRSPSRRESCVSRSATSPARAG